MREKINILIIDSNKEDSKVLSDLLISEKYPQPTIVDNENDFIQLCSTEFNFDVVISEQEIDNINSLQIFNIVKKKCKDAIFILVSNKITDEFGLEVLKEGFDIYFLKSRLFKLPPVIEKLYGGRHIQEKIVELEKANEALKDAYNEIQIKNQNMIESIQFAKRIQNLTLPKIDLLLRNFAEAFILYKPKDIVGGDFYWFHKCNLHEKFMIAIGDCTGHGVSGALLSMIGYNLLNEILHEHDVELTPTEVLSELDGHICELLKQDVNSGYHDGIDMSFVSIDHNLKKIYFCGCRRPLLYLVRADKKIVVYKGEPYLVGGINERIVKTFKTQEIDYQDGDVIYMLTDGYTDQFGGDHNRKLMKDKFAQMLIEIQHLNLTYQSQLLEQRLLKWQGDNEQTDDILVLGIKF